MRLIDEDGNDILEEDCDLSIGEIIETDYISQEAYDSIDNIVKFALAEDDYEHVRMYRLYTDMDYQIKELNEKQEQREALLNELPDTLADTDDALCALYETNLTQQDIIDEQDDAICELYEMITGGI